MATVDKYAPVELDASHISANVNCELLVHGSKCEVYKQIKILANIQPALTGLLCSEFFLQLAIEILSADLLRVTNDILTPHTYVYMYAMDEMWTRISCLALIHSAMTQPIYRSRWGSLSE